MPAAALAAVNKSALGLPPHHVPLGEMHPYDAAMSVARGLQHPPPSAEAAAAFRLAHLAKLAQTDAMLGRLTLTRTLTLTPTLGAGGLPARRRDRPPVRACAAPAPRAPAPPPALTAAAAASYRRGQGGTAPALP